MPINSARIGVDEIVDLGFAGDPEGARSHDFGVNGRSGCTRVGVGRVGTVRVDTERRDGVGDDLAADFTVSRQRVEHGDHNVGSVDLEERPQCLLCRTGRSRRCRAPTWGEGSSG